MSGSSSASRGGRISHRTGSGTAISSGATGISGPSTRIFRPSFCPGAPASSSPMAGTRRAIRGSAALSRGRRPHAGRGGTNFLGDLLRLFGVEIHRDFKALRLDVNPHHAGGGRPDLEVGLHILFGIDTHDTPR